MALAVWRVASRLSYVDRRYLWEEAIKHLAHTVDLSSGLEGLSRAQVDALRSVQMCERAIGQEPSYRAYNDWYLTLDDASSVVAPGTVRFRFGNSWSQVRAALGHTSRQPRAEATRHRLVANGKAITKPEAILLVRLYVLETRDLLVRYGGYRAWAEQRIAAHGEVVRRADVADAARPEILGAWDIPGWLSSWIGCWADDVAMADRARIRKTINGFVIATFVEKASMMEAVGLPQASEGRRTNHSRATAEQGRAVAREAHEWCCRELGQPLSLNGYRQYRRDVDDQLSNGKALREVVRAGVLPPGATQLSKLCGDFNSLLLEIGVIGSEEHRRRRQNARKHAVNTGGLSAVHEATVAGYISPEQYDWFIDHLPPGHRLRRAVHRVRSQDLLEFYPEWDDVQRAAEARAQRRADGQRRRWERDERVW